MSSPAAPSSTSVVPDWQTHMFETPGAEAVTCSVRIVQRHGRPLLGLPARARAARLTLGLYPAQTRVARLLKTALMLATRFRLPLPLPAQQARLDRADPIVGFLLERGLAVQDGHAVLGFFFSPRPGPVRRALLLPFGTDLRPSAVVKIAAGCEESSRIERERAGLQQALSIGAPAPCVLGFVQAEPRVALATEFVPGRTPGCLGASQLYRMLAGWVRRQAPRPLTAFAGWRRVDQAVPEAKRGLRHQVARQSARWQARPVLQHGDFAPWNIRVNPSDGRWVVMDWESADPEGLPLWDWFHCQLQQWVLVQKLDASRVADRARAALTEASLLRLARAAGLPENLEAYYAAFLLHRLYVFGPGDGDATVEEVMRRFEESF